MDQGFEYLDPEDIKSCVKVLQALCKDEKHVRNVLEDKEISDVLKKCASSLEVVEILEYMKNVDTNDELKPSAPEIAITDLKLTQTSPDDTRKRYRPAKLPRNEKERQQLLDSLEILDTERETMYDGILWLVTTICGTEMGAISLVDRDRQFFKSHVGLGVSQTGRNEAFCGHAILQPGKILYVPDTLEDERFAENPLVTGGPQIRFYAGMPLATGDSGFGTLCVISEEARELTEPQLIALSKLGQICRDQMLLRKKNRHLNDMINALSENKEALIIARNRFLKAAEDKVKFLANLTHELRAPLNAIVGYTELIKESSDKKSLEDAECVESISFGSRVLASTVNSVLDFMKIRSGKWNLDISSVKISRVIKSISALQESVAKRKNITLETTIDPTLHRGLMIDQMKLTQAINNIVSNAIKFTEAPGKVWLRAKRVSSQRRFLSHDKKKRTKDDIIILGQCKLSSGSEDMKHHALLVEVEDEGCGIAQKSLVSIFESFQQENSNICRTHGGTGLGLAIVKGIVTMMGGWIYVESTREKGSCFSILVPYEKGNALVEDGAKSVANAADATEGFCLPDHVRLLFAEDDFLSQKLIKRFLVKKGMKCTICSNGQILVDNVKEVLKDKEARPLIFTDLEMPVMDGLSALKELRSLKVKRDLIIVALTGSPEKLREMNPGFDYILGKPLQFKLLHSLMRRICLSIEHVKISRTSP
mmetsp:Transcript_28108/g.39058  ORF Transcript_28108/g.39058 Transcript_28108/m.39058 type:complete len:709 (+) Transcript_28108:285-2411(+)